RSPEQGSRPCCARYRSPPCRMDTMPNRERCVRPKRRSRLITGRFETVDSTPEPSKRAPQRWGKLLQIEGQRTWRPEEFGEILRHQLNAPLGSRSEEHTSELQSLPTSRMPS